MKISHTENSSFKYMINKVPQVTMYFWVIKILCTTMGETAADYLIENFLGLVNTTYVMSAILIFALIIQFKARKYIPVIYWLTVVLLSVVGTLITDILTDKFQVSLITSTILFTFTLIATFIIWYKKEHTLSIHSINTRVRESFYWLVILFTFALGTAAGDLSAEKLRLGYLTSIFIFGALIVAVAVSRFVVKKSLPKDHSSQTSIDVLSFWSAYILTRPLGASIGDYLSQPKRIGGLGFGTTSTSMLFFGTILLLVVYLSITKKDEEPAMP